jgi:hypothetical protein
LKQRGHAHGGPDGEDRGGVWAAGRLVWAGPTWIVYLSIYLKNYSNRFEMIWSKDRLPVLEKMQIKYGLVENEIRNNSPYWNFSKFEIEFELKKSRTL